MFYNLKNLLTLWRDQKKALPFAVLFQKFQSILARNNQILELMADMDDKLGGEYVFDRRYIEDSAEKLGDYVFKLISDLSILTQRKHTDLFLAYERIHQSIHDEMSGRHVMSTDRLVIPFSELGHELSDQVGIKMAQLGDIRNRLGLSTPDGFVITTQALYVFMKQNGLLERSAEAVAYWRANDIAALERLSREMQDSIRGTPVPRLLRSQIFAEFDNLAKRLHVPNLRLALRSSAWGEGSDLGFAGQYESVSNIPREHLIDGYRRVVASACSFKAWQYRFQKGYHTCETAIAVGCQAMTDSLVAGILQTYASQAGGEARLANAMWGQCSSVADNHRSTDTIVLDRTPPYALRSFTVAEKPQERIPAPEGSPAANDNPAALREVPGIRPEQLQHLAQAAMSIERYYKRPQEIEWACDSKGTLLILQTRPLHNWEVPFLPPSRPGDANRGAEIVFSRKGFVAQSGVAVGKVFLVENDADLRDFPFGAILLSRYTSPRFSSIMGKASGVITDIGSPTGNMATIAREYRVPTIVNTEVATSLLRTGEEITLDATRNIVYRGPVNAIGHFEPIENEVFEDSYEYRLLRRMLKHVISSSIPDSQSETLSLSDCLTYHDITRYIHEKAVEGLICLSEKLGAQYLSAPKRLEMAIPLGLTVVDGGGGTRCSPEAHVVTPEQIVSLPLRDFLDGLNGSGMWPTDPVPVKFGSFMASFTRTFSASLASPKEVGRNLAVVLKNYMNINLRLGYHFTVIDANIDRTSNDNYINFRFLGGVTEFARRSRRALFIAKILEYYDFRVEVHGDMVIGRLNKLSQPRISERMRMLGSLVGYSRQLDACMHSDEDVTDHVQMFINAMHNSIGGVQ